MELEGTIGRRVKISLEDGSNIDGFVHSYSANTGKISLEKVECFENGRKKKLVGLQHYFAEEITSIIVTEDVCKHKKKTKTQESTGNGGMLRGKCESSHLNRLEFIDPCSLVLKNKRRDDTLTSSGNETGSSDSDYDALPQSDEYTILPKLSNTFYEAVAYIKKHQVIALAMEGISIGRFGRLCWLQIAVPGHVFMFDVLQMGRACFEEGLKDVLENEDILKVLHDCRMVSDLLHHQYDINMINVFDTQVANVFVYRLRHHHDWPRYVDGLGSALVQHLDLSMEEVNWAVVRERRREEDEEVWKERPPQRHLVEAAVKNVKHLIELRQVLMEKMMEEFVAGVNIYLMHVRDASDSDAKRYQTTPHLLPVAFQDIQAFMSSYRGQNPHFKVKTVQKDMNGFRENCSGIVQPDVYFSKDSIWHGGSKKTGIKGPRSLTNRFNSQVSTQGNSTATIDNQNAEKFQENVSVPTGTQMHSASQSDIDSISRNETSIPTRRHISVSESDGVSGVSVQSDETVIPSRRNIHSSPESDLIAKAVAAMNAKKLVLNEISQSEFSEAQTVDVVLGETRRSEVNAGELRGGSLMRALVHEQDATGYEATASIEKFSILPAGKMIGINKIKSSSDLDNSVKPQGYSRSQSTTRSVSHVQNYQLQNGVSPNIGRPESANSRADLRPAIPGGDIASYSPPRHSRLTEDELYTLERLQHSQIENRQEQNVFDTRNVGSLSDNDISHRSSSRAANSRLNDQLQGKSSSHSCTSKQMNGFHNPLSEGSGHDDGYNNTGSASLRSHSGSVQSGTNPKLKNLFQKLKQQS